MSTPAYRSLRTHAAVAAAGAGIGTAAAVVDTLTPGSSLAILGDAAHATSSELALVWSLLAGMLLQLATLFVWAYGAARNVRALGRTGLRFTPFTTVAWWFMPLVCLYMPYRALSEAWRASDPGDPSPDGWQRQKAPAKLLGWWLSMWISAFVGSDDPTALGFVGIALTVASSAWFVLLAFELAARQDELAARLSPAGP